MSGKKKKRKQKKRNHGRKVTAKVVRSEKNIYQKEVILKPKNTPVEDNIEEEKKLEEVSIDKESEPSKKEADRIKRYLCVSIAGFLISAGAVFPLEFMENKNSAGELFLIRIAGILFWAGLIEGIFSYTSLYRSLKEGVDLQNVRKGLPSFLRFFDGTYGKIIDGVWFFTLGLTILFSVAGIRVQFLETLVLFLLILTTYLHFIVTGKIFHYWNIGKRADAAKDADKGKKKTGKQNVDVQSVD